MRERAQGAGRRRLSPLLCPLNPRNTALSKPLRLVSIINSNLSCNTVYTLQCLQSESHQRNTRTNLKEQRIIIHIIIIIITCRVEKLLGWRKQARHTWQKAGGGEAEGETWKPEGERRKGGRGTRTRRAHLGRVEAEAVELALAHRVQQVVVALRGRHAAAHASHKSQTHTKVTISSASPSRRHASTSPPAA